MNLNIITMNKIKSNNKKLILNTQKIPQYFKMKELNKYSKTVTQDPTQPAAQAMLHAIGLTKEDLKVNFELQVQGMKETLVICI